MKEDNEAITRSKADFYFKEKIKVHINFKTGYWKRGIILEVSSDFFTLDETLEGKQPIFFSQISSIEKYRESK